MASDFKIGESAETLVALDELNTPLNNPQWQFHKYREKVKLGSNKSRGLGPQTIIWAFPMIDAEQIEQLEEYNTGVPIYIRSRKRDLTFGVFEVTYNWQDPRQDGSHIPYMPGMRSDVEIEFTVLSEVA